MRVVRRHPAYADGRLTVRCRSLTLPLVLLFAATATLLWLSLVMLSTLRLLGRTRLRLRMCRRLPMLRRLRGVLRLPLPLRLRLRLPTLDCLRRYLGLPLSLRLRLRLSTLHRLRRHLRLPLGLRLRTRCFRRARNRSRLRSAALRLPRVGIGRSVVALESPLVLRGRVGARDGGTR